MSYKNMTKAERRCILTRKQIQVCADAGLTRGDFRELDDLAGENGVVVFDGFCFGKRFVFNLGCQGLNVVSLGHLLVRRHACHQ